MSHLRDVRDRTSEFFSTVQAIQRQIQPNDPSVNKHSSSNGGSGSLNPSQIPTENKNYQQPSQFLTAASVIGGRIMEVAGKLEELTKLAKQRGIYNDPTRQIQHLTNVIKTDLQQTDSDINMLTEFVKKSLAAGSGQSAANSTVIVNDLQSKLASKTTSFQTILQNWTKNVQSQNDRRQEFESSSSRRQRPVHNHYSLMDDDYKEDGEETPLHNDDHAVSVMDLVQEQENKNEYVASRAQAVESIESTIVEIGSMYKRLATIVQLQEEITVRIDTNIDVTLENVEGGYTQLLKYFHSVSGNQWLIIKVFALLIAFAIFFIVFVA